MKTQFRIEQQSGKIIALSSSLAVAHMMDAVGEQGISSITIIDESPLAVTREWMQIQTHIDHGEEFIIMSATTDMSEADEDLSTFQLVITDLMFF